LLNALYDLGKIYTEKENFQKIDLLLDDLSKVESTIIVEFEKNGDNFKYISTNEKKFSTDDTHLYLYKKGSPRGTDLTPSTKITEVDKTFNSKFFKWFDNNKKNNPLVKELFNEISYNEDLIKEDIKNVFGNLESKKISPLLSISIKENDKVNYLENYDFFKNQIIEKATEKYSTKKTNPTKKGYGQCYLCGKDKEVMGLVPNAIGFTFSTVDKRGNLPGLSYDNQWKLIPICLDCALDLESGNKFIEKYLSFSEFGLKYFVIPNFLFEKNNVVDELFDMYLSQEYEKSYYNTIVSEEDEISEKVEDLDNIIEFKFLFYEKSNSAFNIIGYVEDVVPSWIGKLCERQIEINKNALFKEDIVKIIFNKKDKDDVGDLLDFINSSKEYYNVNKQNWIFGFLKDFFVYKDNNNYKFFIDVVSSIFSAKKVNFDFILSFVMKKIRMNFRKDNEYFVKIFTLEFLMLFRFLRGLDLLLDYGEKMANEEVNKSFEKNNEELMKEYLEELNNPAKKASFLLGVLTRKLITIQLIELNSTPFTNKLWGLSLDEKKIKKLYPMVLNKLNEYKIAHYYLDLSEDISLNLLETDKNWNLSRDETSFYFVLGYTLNKLYQKPKNDENSKKENY